MQSNHSAGSRRVYAFPDSLKSPSMIFIPSSTFSSSNFFPTTCTPTGKPCIAVASYILYMSCSIEFRALNFFLSNASNSLSTCVTGRMPAE